MPHLRRSAQAARLLSDSRRQINSFHLSGDIFGLENGGVHRFTAEAVVETTVSLISRQSLEDVAEFDAVLSRNLLGLFVWTAPLQSERRVVSEREPVQEEYPTVRRGAIGERGAIFQLDFKAPSGTTGSDSRPADALDRDPQSSPTREPGLRKRNQRLGSG
jgi:hypothetical protein